MKNQNISVQYQIPVLMLGFICLAYGIGSYLLRWGWNLSWPSANPISLHGLILSGGLPWIVGATLMTIASIIFGIATAHMFYHQQALFALTLLMSGISWVFTNILWISYLSIEQVAPWWIAFIVLLVACERLELSSIRPSQAFSKIIFKLIITLLLVGSALTPFSNNLNLQHHSVALSGQ